MPPVLVPHSNVASRTGCCHGVDYVWRNEGKKGGGGGGRGRERKRKGREKRRIMIYLSTLFTILPVLKLIAVTGPQS